MRRQFLAKKLSLETKKPLHQVKKICDPLRNHHQNHNKTSQCGHGGLLVPTGAGQYLVQDGYNDADRTDLKYQINIHS